MNVPKDGQRGMSMVFGDMSKNLNGQLSDYRYFSVILVSIGCISCGNIGYIVAGILKILTGCGCCGFTCHARASDDEESSRFCGSLTGFVF